MKRSQAEPSIRVVFAHSGVLFLISLFLTSYSSRNPEVIGFGSRLIQEVTAPVQNAISLTRSKVVGFFDEYRELRDAKDRNDQLLSRLAVLEMENARLREFETENSRLAKLLSFKQANKLEGVVGRIIGNDASNWVHSIIVNVGSSDGISIGDPVVDGSGGVVGRVVSVSSNSSQVLLIIDRASAVDVMLQEKRIGGILSGREGSECELSFVELEKDVQIGDRVITSGLDGIYPKSLPVGVVSFAEKDSRGLFRKVLVTPHVDFRRLEEVLIITSTKGER
jgi:rod shape-determining protein MreC